MRDDELYHYGVKGMKWGVWNAETKQRRTGSAKMKHVKAISSGLGTGVRVGTSTVLRSLLTTGTIANPATMAIGIGTSMLVTFAVAEVKQTKAYAKGKQRVYDMLNS